MEKITPKIDIAFKKIFGVEENKDLLIALINSIVTKEDQVTEVTILNPYNPRNFKNEKLSILDIKAVSAEGKKFNIEIQIHDEADYDKRALYYWSKLYAESLQAGHGYSHLTKTIGIHILNFNQITESQKYHNVFNIVEKEEGFAYFEDLELHTIELNKFTSEDDVLSDVLAKIKNSLDIWAAFLARNDLLKLDQLPQELSNQPIKKALNVLEVMNFNDEERDRYEGAIKFIRGELGAIKKAKLDGIKEGIKERDVAIVKECFKNNLPIETITNITKLSLEDLEKIKQGLEK